MRAIERAIEHFGGLTPLAKVLGVTPGFISQWKSGHRRVPAEHCPKIERATEGAVRCEDLRPDVDWAYLRATDCDVKVSLGDTTVDERKVA